MAFTRLMGLHLLTVDLLLHSSACYEAVHHHAPLLPYAVCSAGGSTPISVSKMDGIRSPVASHYDETIWGANSALD